MFVYIRTELMELLCVEETEPDRVETVAMEYFRRYEPNL